LDSVPPSLPLRIDFDLEVIGQESYKRRHEPSKMPSPPSLLPKQKILLNSDLAVKNLGSFRDVASIDTGPLPDGLGCNIDGWRKAAHIALRSAFGSWNDPIILNCRFRPPSQARQAVWW